MNPPPDDTTLLAEIDRRFRQRFAGVWLCWGLAALLSTGVIFSVPMMHSGHPTAAMGTIVAVETDAAGETWMTSEFTDADGVTHRDRQTQGYHYAPGDPVVGQRIEYLYERSDLTGDMHMYPRADRLLQIVFGVPLLFLALFGLAVAILVVRQRNLRRRLVRNGLREQAQAPAIRHRQLLLPGPSIAMWRLVARRFDPLRSLWVDIHSDWQPAPAPPPEHCKGVAPVVFVDPQDPSRYWLPVSGVAPPA